MTSDVFMDVYQMLVLIILSEVTAVLISLLLLYTFEMSINTACSIDRTIEN